MKILNNPLTKDNIKKVTFNWICWYVNFHIHSFLRYTPIYPYLFRAYWHSILYKGKKENMTCYYTARPNHGAGIGHQLGNWNAGLWYSRKFNLKFAYSPFSESSWDDFLGFKSTDPSVEDLKEQGYKIRKLPYFREENIREEEIQKRIIKSYGGERIVFIASQDQSYKKQYEVMDEIRSRFYNAPSRVGQVLKYDFRHFNIAIHVRRGDIMLDSNTPGIVMRYLSNDYFEKVLRQVVEKVNTNKPIHIWLFSQGIPEDYPEFANYSNIHWCMDMEPQESFLHMVYADLLITSKSSFSYKPALLNKGIKVCPRNFWHGYPKTKDYVMVEDDGTIKWR